MAVIHKIQVPTDDYALVLDAKQWLEERLGKPSWLGKHKTEVPTPFDPSLLETADYDWDAYVDPLDFQAFFRIKGHEDVALLFKLTFGGTNDNH